MYAHTVCICEAITVRKSALPQSSFDTLRAVLQGSGGLGTLPSLDTCACCTLDYFTRVNNTSSDRLSLACEPLRT